MTGTLVTLLGRARKREGGAGYEKATYRFPDGTEVRTAFFGLALASHLKPDEVVVLGTAGSLWSLLVEDLAGEGSGDEDARLELMAAEESRNVAQPLLDRLAPLMGQAVNAVVRPTLIPAAANEDEQYAILRTVDKVVPDGHLDFDLTHGFRHLGMVGFLSSFMLERVRRLNVRGLWYGALDMKTPDGAAQQVLRLDGLTRVRRWLDALDRFDATGDYGVFAPLLRDDGVPADKAKCLEDAAFLERTLNVRDAARKIGTFLPVLDEPLSGASGLFQRRLAERLCWAKAEPLSEQQHKLAHQYLSRGDFVRAAMFGWEACVSRVCEEHDVPMAKYKERQEALEQFEDEVEGARRTGFQSLRVLRNALAHGAQPERPQSPRIRRLHQSIRSALRDPQKLSGELAQAIQGSLDDRKVGKAHIPY